MQKKPYIVIVFQLNYIIPQHKMQNKRRSRSSVKLIKTTEHL